MGKHLVDIYPERCSACTRCMRVCPVEALRIIDQKVALKHDLCIYCGNCISGCHKSAFKVTSDSFAELNNYKVNVAILPLASYGMITDHKEHQLCYQTLYNFGFDEVYDLSIVTHHLAEKINEMLKAEVNHPYFLTQCPTIIRLIKQNYPTLMDYLLPFDFPFEIGAKIARKKFSAKYGVSPEEVGISYISECLSNFVAIKEPIGKKRSNIDHVFLFHDIFKSIIKTNELKKPFEVGASYKGVLYAKSEAIPRTTEIKEYITVDGINHVTDLFEKVYLNTIPKVKIIEAYSCTSGCVGGNFALENPFIAKWRVMHYANTLSKEESPNDVAEDLKWIDYHDWFFTETIESMNKDMPPLTESIRRMNKIHQILAKLPQIDCCACGSPTCRALAEDIVDGIKTLNDCVVIHSSR